jgi:hypothetical protein
LEVGITIAEVVAYAESPVVNWTHSLVSKKKFHRIGAPKFSRRSL